MARNTITSIDRDPFWAAFLVHAAFSKHPQIWTALNKRMMRDVKAFQIFDGTSQIQMMVIGRHCQKAGMPIDEELAV